MTIVVHKYGGTSVGTLPRMQAVAERIIADTLLGYQVVVVVSAMAGETDRLIQMAKALQLKPEAREYAVLVTTGEQVTTALLAMALLQKGCAARSYSGCQIPIQTDNSYEMAEIKQIDTTSLLADVKQHIIPIVAGFQGMTESGHMTTLGRGGSDTTAIALAAALGAKECKIFTDVAGVYTADPKMNPQAKLLDYVDIDTMLNMASHGAKVLQLRAVELAYQYRVPLRVLSSFDNGVGTVICYPDGLSAQVANESATDQVAEQR
jgi:aspartate kinase